MMNISSTIFYSQSSHECLLFNKLNNKCNSKNISNVELLNIIKENILSIYNPKDGESKIIKGEENIIFQITNSKNELALLQNNSLNNQSISILDLGQCEIILKKEYNIKEEDSLVFIKQENMNCTASEKNIQFDVFEPYNFTKLNLSICEGITINLYVKTELSEETHTIFNQMKSMGYDMLNINDPFYQDICTPYKSSNNTDILLSDRIDYIYNNKDSQCQPNCHFSNYLPNSLYLNCTCEVIEDNNNDPSHFSGKKIFESFYDILKYSNFKILKCYKLVFNKNIFTNNLGNIIIFIIVVIYIFCFIIFIIKGIEPLKNKLKEIKINIEEENIEKNKIFICNTLKKDKICQEKINKNDNKLFFPPIRKTQLINSNLDNKIKKAKKTKKRD